MINAASPHPWIYIPRSIRVTSGGNRRTELRAMGDCGLEDTRNKSGHIGGPARDYQELFASLAA